MKSLKHYPLLLVFLLSLLLANCEKVDLKMELLDDPTSELNTSALKATPMDVTAEIDYLLGLIETIESLLEEGLLNKGNANALIVKIQNAIKSIEKGNTNAATGQLGSFTSQVEAFVENGVIPEDIGEELVNTAENGIILAEGSFTDPRDGQEYSVVLIGDQLWMAENLAFLPYVSPPTIGSEVDSHCYVYGYEGTNIEEAQTTSNYTTYGVLYNWAATQTAAPDGWHVPNNADWYQLARYISDDRGGYTQDISGHWSEVGGHLKSEIEWLFDGNGTNDYGFSALPGGERRAGDQYYLPNSFHALGELGIFSVDDVSGFLNAQPIRWLWNRNSDNTLYKSNDDRGNAFSIRCIKD